MRTPISRARSMATLLAVFGFTPAFSQAAGFYMDAAIGQSSVGGVSQSDLDDAMLEYAVYNGAAFFSIDDSRLDKKDTGYSFAVGYRFTPHVGVEATYIQLGEVRYAADARVIGDVGDPMEEITTGFNLKSSGPAVSLVGTWPVIASLSLDVRAAAYFSKTKVSTFATNGVYMHSESLESEDDTSLLVGAGATWALTPKFGLRLGYARLQEAVAGEGDVDSLSLGIRVTF